MKDIQKVIFSPVTMVVLLVILAVALGTATFIENDFGAEVARMKVYNSRWLEFILILLSVNLIGRVIKLKLYQAKKFTIFLFHIALVVMIIGAAVTRYFGYEGSMHIREGSSSSTLVTAQKVLSVTIDENTTYTFDANIEQTHSFRGKISDQFHSFNISLENHYENAYEKAVERENGSPVVGFVLAGNSFRGFEYLKHKEIKSFGPIDIAFNSPVKTDVNIYVVNDSLFMTSSFPVFVSSMGGNSGTMKVNDKIFLEAKTMYKVKDYSIVLREFFPSAEIIALPTEVKGHMRGNPAMIFKVDNGTDSKEITVWENKQNNETNWGQLGQHKIGISYGNEKIELPFQIHLDDFVIERYPGSMSPSSFSSYVTLKEEGITPIDFHIYMNNILKHKGFRFYQSSYDQDEKGTILSVNNDKWGTMISYFGYFILTLGMLLSLINTNSFFRKTVIRNAKSFLIGTLLLSGGALSLQAQSPHGTSPHGQAQSGMHQHANVQPKEPKSLPADFVEIDLQQAEAFGKLLIQNNTGRTEPIYTYASEIMRKISRKEEMYDMSAVQLFMEMNMDPQQWIDIPLIRVTNKELQTYLGLSGKYAAYTDFISDQQGYLLQNLVQQSFAKSPTERSKFDKAVMKTDEKVNICYAIFSGRYMKILPLPKSSGDSNWYTSTEASLKASTPDDSIFYANILTAYYDEINKGRISQDYKQAEEFLQGLNTYQRKNAAYELPSEFRTNVEVIYYKQNPFKKLFPFYATSGVIFLFILIGIIVAGRAIPRWINSTFFIIILIAFMIHTLGIAARWYISGHAPMSNGYESMIFISWVTLLAGFLFHKRSPFAIPATAALGGLTLMVANLSFMDPQITNLVPVLQSYWLTIHVSIITASYGFLALGALLGIINLILIILRTSKNNQHIVETLESLTIINHKTLIAGLYLLTIGTFLGAVWANESWGRYWGWDPKETWALISIIVYTIVTHSRLVPGMKGIFIFNTLALFGMGSILMTYFGVNYYLSGLHSYAAGDPVPVPTFVYYTVASIILLTLGASIKYRKMVSTEKK